jgi:hypothetical protein
MRFRLIARLFNNVKQAGFPPAAGLTLIHGFPEAFPGIKGFGMVITTACTWLCAATQTLRTIFLPFINSTRKLSISLPRNQIVANLPIEKINKIKAATRRSSMANFRDAQTSPLRFPD